MVLIFVMTCIRSQMPMTRYSCKAAMLEMIKRYPGESLLRYAKGSLQEDVDVLAAVQASEPAKNGHS